MTLTQDLPLREKADVASNGGPVTFGRELREQQFLLDPSYRNLNHGMPQTKLLYASTP